MDFKKRIISILLTIAVLLLVVNIIWEAVSKDSKEKQVKEVSVSQIEKVFSRVLDEYGIDSTWISRKKIKEDKYDSVKSKFVVKVPVEVPITFILRDLNASYDTNVVKLTSDEIKNYGNSIVKIYSENKLKLLADLNVDKELSRSTSEIAFIISDASDLGSGSFEEVLKSTSALDVVLVPSEENIAKIALVDKYSKKYSLLISDEISGSKFVMEKDFSKDRLKSAVRSILGAFQDADLFLVDTKSAIYNSAVYNYVRDEFKKRGKILHPVSDFIDLYKNNNNELISLFNFYCTDGAKGKNRIFYVSRDKFDVLTNAIGIYKKKGNKVVFPSKLIQK